MSTITNDLWQNDVNELRHLRAALAHAEARLKDLERRIRQARRLLTGPEPRFVMDDVLAVLDLRRRNGRR